VEETVRDGALLCGDAAGHVIPISGEAIHPAMVAGRLAGQVAAEAVPEGDVSARRLAEYRDLFDREWGVRIELGLMARLAFEKLPDEKIDRVLELVDPNYAAMLIDGLDAGPFIRDMFSKDPELCVEIFGSLVEEVVGCR